MPQTDVMFIYHKLIKQFGLFFPFLSYINNCALEETSSHVTEILHFTPPFDLYIMRYPLKCESQ